MPCRDSQIVTSQEAVFFIELPARLSLSFCGAIDSEKNFSFLTILMNDNMAGIVINGVSRQTIALQ